MALSLNEEALKDFDSAIELQNDNCKFYHGKGLAYQEMGDYQQAIKMFELALDKSTEEVIYQ